MTAEALLEAARTATGHAHAPYSNYRVGAALLCSDGTVFAGCNIENASYGLGNCAERTAIFSAVAAGHRDFAALAVVASGDNMPFPCGACRQVMSEFFSDELPVYIAVVDALNDCQTITMADLLPHRFQLEK